MKETKGKKGKKIKRYSVAPHLGGMIWFVFVFIPKYLPRKSQTNPNFPG